MITTGLCIEPIIQYNYYMHRATAQSLVAVEQRTEARIKAAKILQAIISAKRDQSVPGIAGLIDYLGVDTTNGDTAIEDEIRGESEIDIAKQNTLLTASIENGKIMYKEYGELILENAYNEDAARTLASRPPLYIVENDAI